MLFEFFSTCRVVINYTRKQQRVSANGYQILDKIWPMSL